jgi:hypothetical protein
LQQFAARIRSSPRHIALHRNHKIKGQQATSPPDINR